MLGEGCGNVVVPRDIRKVLQIWERLNQLSEGWISEQGNASDFSVEESITVSRRYDIVLSRHKPAARSITVSTASGMPLK